VDPRLDAFKTWAEEPSRWSPQLASAGVSGTRFVAAGGQGMVFEGAVGTSRAAIKLYYPGQVHRRVQREINALGLLHGKTIVRLLWSGSLAFRDEPISVVATDFVDGTPLSEYLRTAGPLSDPQLRRLIYDVASAIRELWTHRIVHRDIKPDNIMLERDGRASVIDLGLARHLGMSSLTELGATWGTFGYLSPEQAKAVRQLTCKSDVYALGVSAIEAVCGHHPSERDQFRLFSLRLDQRLPPPASRSRYAALLSRMVHPRATARPLPEQIINAVQGDSLP